MSSENHSSLQQSASESAADQLELQALAEELQRELPVGSPVSAEFSVRLRSSLSERPWSLRAALHQSPFLRAAAAVLVMSSVAAPVSALVFLLQPTEQAKFELGFELPTQFSQVIEEVPRPLEPTVPPLDADFENAFGLDWQAAVARSNRMALVIAQWSDAVPSVAAFGVAARTPQFQDWAQATAADLKSEFERRALLGLTQSAPSSLEQRLLELTDGLTDAELPAELAAWRWVLAGDGPPPVKVYFPAKD